MEYSISCPLWT